MITLSREVFDQEMENTTLDIAEESAKAWEEDEVFMRFYEMCAKRMADLPKNKNQVLAESLFALRHLLGVQQEVNFLEGKNEL